MNSKQNLEDYIIKLDKCLLCSKEYDNESNIYYTCINCENSYHSNCYDDYIKNTKYTICIFCKKIGTISFFVK